MAGSINYVIDLLFVRKMKSRKVQFSSIHVVFSPTHRLINAEKVPHPKAEVKWMRITCMKNVYSTTSVREPTAKVNENI